MSDSGTGDGGNSLCWSAPLQYRSGCYKRGAVGERIAVAAGGAAVRCVSGKICVRDSGAGICNAHRVARAGEGRSYAIHAPGPFAESAGPPALRPRCRPSLQAKASRNFGARYEAQIGLERAGSVEVKTLKRLQALQSYKPGCCNDVPFVTNHERGWVVFHKNHAFIVACHGSSKTQNVEDALAHAPGGKPLACAAPE